MFKIFHLLIFLMLAFTGNAQNSVPFIKNNPIIPDMIADPSIVKINGTWYCYATTDGYGQGLATSGPPVVWKSTDFVNWSLSGNFFPSARGEKYWAPSKAIPVNGKYWLYPTLNSIIYAAVADSPEGPFRLVNGADTLYGATAPKPMLGGKGPKGTKGIDAEILIDDDGQAYMYWAQRGAAKLKSDMMTLDTAITVISTKRGGYSEGPIAFKRKGIYYYLYTLEGHENYQYAYQYSRISPLGPFIFPENDIITTTDRARGIYGPGHGCVFNDPDTGLYYIGYLEFGIGGTNRQVWVDKLNFNDDGTIQPVVLTHEGVGALAKTSRGPNLATTAKVSTSSTLSDLAVKPIKDPLFKRTESYQPGNAIDGTNGTRWMAAKNDSIPVFMLDLGSVKKVKRTEVFFTIPTAGHAYLLECSKDGKEWEKCGGSKEIKIQSPHVDLISLKTRYIRLTILKGDAGLWELKVY